MPSSKDHGLSVYLGDTRRARGQGILLVITYMGRHGAVVPVMPLSRVMERHAALGAVARLISRMCSPRGESGPLDREREHRKRTALFLRTSGFELVRSNLFVGISRGWMPGLAIPFPLQRYDLNAVHEARTKHAFFQAQQERMEAYSFEAVPAECAGPFIILGHRSPGSEDLRRARPSCLPLRLAVFPGRAPAVSHAGSAMLPSAEGRPRRP